MITYEYTDPIKVKLEGEVVGTINKVDSGYRYVPKNGTRYAGDVMPTIRDVKKSIESE